jgi:KipI family sensor histidine kinase inhibitor
MADAAMTPRTPLSQAPVIAPLGDDALIVTFAREISWDVGVAVRAAARRIRDLHLAHVTDVVPAYTTLAVHFDGGGIPFDSLAPVVAQAIGVRDSTLAESPASVEIPVRYDGPDLADVAARTGLTINEIVERHSSRTYRAYMTGFVPGFAYLGDLDESLVLPRRAVPRVRVAPGSVAIAGAQTAVYPLQTPGGWHLIGTTRSVMFDALRDPPALIHPGDLVRFVKID